MSFAETLNATMVALLVSFTVVFVLWMLVKPFRDFALAYLAMDTAAFLAKVRLWQAVTSIFLHSGLCHFLGNMAFLWFFGSSLANAWRRRAFLTYFFVCGIVASLCSFAFSSLFLPHPVRSLGASGAVFGLMIGYAMIYGNRTIIAFFLIPMKAKLFVAICMGIEIVLLLSGTQDGIGHVAHIGGAVCGAVYLKLAWRRHQRLAAGGGRKRTAASRIAGLEVMDDADP